MEIQDIQKVRTALQRIRKIAIVFHFNPDGDALGSALALYHHFSDEGYEVSVISPNLYPSFLNWMPGSDQIIVAQQHPKKAVTALLQAEMLFIVDMNAPHRAGQELEKAITQSTAFKVLIDHHVEPDIDCDVMYSTAQTSSASELVYDFLYRYLFPERTFTAAIAEVLYVGIITDTGSVTYACNCPSTYEVLEKIIASGIDGEAIHRKIYDNYSESRIRLLGLTLSQRLKIMPEYGASYMYLTHEDLITHHYQIGDTEGFVNYGISLGNVHYTAFFTERDNRIRVSFRSKGQVDVNKLARKYFNGGGHHNAAGAFYDGPIEEALAYFEKAVKEIAAQGLE